MGAIPNDRVLHGDSVDRHPWQHSNPCLLQNINTTQEFNIPLFHPPTGPCRFGLMRHGACHENTAVARQRPMGYGRFCMQCVDADHLDDNSSVLLDPLRTLLRPLHSDRAAVRRPPVEEEDNSGLCLHLVAGYRILLALHILHRDRRWLL